MKYLILFSLLSFILTLQASSLSYPNGAKKAVIFSYDDGVVQDRKLVALFNQYKVVGTFNISSGLFSQKAPWLKDIIGKTGEYINQEEVKSLFAGHEIAGHSHTHPGLAGLERNELIKQVQRDQSILSKLSGSKIDSFAYPLGSFDENAKIALKDAGFSNARTVIASNSFQLPVDHFEWHPTIHHKDAMPLIAAYKQLQTDQLTVMMIWGHSWEFDQNEPNNSWEYIEELLSEIANQDDIWYVSAGEYIEFISQR